MALLISFLGGPLVAEESKTLPKGMKKVSIPAPSEVKEPGLVVGENVTPGMPLKQAMELLGIPKYVSVQRGPVHGTDSIRIEYPEHDLTIHALSGGTTVEGIEIGPMFKGSFDSGIKLGDKFPSLIDKYGVPKSMSSRVARYPDRGLYFLLNEDTLLSAKTYAKGTKLMDAKLMNP